MKTQNLNSLKYYLHKIINLKEVTYKSQTFQRTKLNMTQ